MTVHASADERQPFEAVLEAPHEEDRRKVNPNLGFQSLGGFHYFSASSLGSNVPEAVLAEENDDILIDDEDEDVVGRLIIKASGGLTCVAMILGFVGVFVFCSIDAILAQIYPPALVTYAVFLGITIAALCAVLLLRIFWIYLIIHLFFPESKFLIFITDCVDPELWLLAWAVTQWAIWSTALVTTDDGRWKIDFVSDSWQLQLVENRHENVIRLSLVIMLVWAIRNVFVKAIMVKLLLGFLMNFNDELIALFHKYALIRRLNAGWIRLIPSGATCDMSEVSCLSGHVGVQMSAARTVALMRREGSKIGESRSREDSKVRMSIRDESRMTMTRSLSRLRGATITQDETTADPARISIKIDEVEGNGPPNSASKLTGNRLAFPNFTPALRRKRVREFHVETTGKSLPPLLEKSHIYSLAKSRMLNMVSIKWLRQNPIVIFLDGQRTELSSKKGSRQAAAQLFESLLAFRHSLGIIEEEMANDHLDSLRQHRAGLALAALSLARARQAPTISESSSNMSTLPRKLPLVPSDDITLRESAAPLVRLEPTAIHQARPPESESAPSEAEKGTTPSRQSTRSVGKKTLKSDKKSSLWFRKRGGSTSVMSENLEYTGHRPYRSRENPNKSVSVRPPLLPPMPGPKIMNEAQLAAITAAEIKKVKLIMPDDKDCLTQDFFEIFMPVSEAKDLMVLLDPGKLGKVTSKMFIKGVVQLYRSRKQMVHSLEAQEEIEKTFRRVCSYLMTFFSLLAVLGVAGVSANTILVSGAAVLSAAIVTMSFVYTDFIQSIILIVFLNPYRIGDRVRIDGEAQYVKRITTYFTEFESLHGKVQYLSHKELSGKLLINESRCKVATTEIAVLFSEKTTPSQYAALKKVLDAYLKSRPLEWIGDSLFVFIEGIGPSQFIRVSIWATHTESWGNWMAIRTQESALFHFIMRQATVLGMYYRLPIQRWEPYASATSLNQPTTYGGISTPASRVYAPGRTFDPPRPQPHPIFEVAAAHGSPPPDSTRTSFEAVQRCDRDEETADDTECPPQAEEIAWDLSKHDADDDDERRMEVMEDFREELLFSSLRRRR